MPSELSGDCQRCSSCTAQKSTAGKVVPFVHGMLTQLPQQHLSSSSSSPIRNLTWHSPGNALGHLGIRSRVAGELTPSSPLCIHCDGNQAAHHIWQRRPALGLAQSGQ